MSFDTIFKGRKEGKKLLLNIGLPPYFFIFFPSSFNYREGKRECNEKLKESVFKTTPLLRNTIIVLLN